MYLAKCDDLMRPESFDDCRDWIDADSAADSVLRCARASNGKNDQNRASSHEFSGGSLHRALPDYLLAQLFAAASGR
jgi:hypothetical protein